MKEEKKKTPLFTELSVYSDERRCPGDIPVTSGGEPM